MKKSLIFDIFELDVEFCQTPVLGLGLGVDFSFAPLHISPTTFVHLPGNQKQHLNCCQTPGIKKLGLLVKV